MRPSHFSSGTAGTSQRVGAVELRRINAILEACGVSEVRGSPHIYVHPESIHLIAAQDLDFLVAHAEVLATRRDLRYDVRSFTGILWGMIGTAAQKIERILYGTVASPHSPNGSVHARTVFPNGESSTPLSTLTERGSANADVASVYTNVFPHLMQVLRVTTLLRSFESKEARAEVRAARRIAQVDIDVMARLATTLSTLLLGEAGEPLRSAEREIAAVNVIKGYTSMGHQLFRTTESALSSTMLLLASLTARPGSDASPILRFFHSVDAWRASGLGLLITDSYGKAIKDVLFALLQRRRDFDNVEEVAAKLFLERLSSRPPYQWRPFRLLYFTVQTARSGNPCFAEQRQGSCAFGLLILFRRVQLLLQSCLVTDSHHSAEEASFVKALRNAVFAQVRRTWLSGDAIPPAATAQKEPAPSAEQGTRTSHLLSYYELLVLAALQGMPEADLTREAELLRRAEVTELSAEPEVLIPSFLRLLLACCYTVTASKGSAAPHALISTPSTLALYESLSRHVFQIALCSKASTSTEVSELYAVDGLGVAPLVELCVWSVIQNTHEDQREMAEGREFAGDASAATAISTETAAVSSSGSGHRAALPPLPPLPMSKAEDGASIPPLPPAPTPISALFHLIRRDVRLLFAGNEDVLRHTPEADRVRAKNFPDGFRVMTLATVRLLFHGLRAAEFFHHIPPTDMLPVVALLYSLRAYYPLSSSATEAERKATQRHIALMQNTLATLPQMMKARTVCELLSRTLVPMSTGADHANRLQLARFEAYLRSMATASAANAVTEDLMLRHWVDVALPAITNRYSAALSNAGHDFLTAAFRAEKYVSPLFVPTYVALYIPHVALESAGDTVGQASVYPPLSLSVIQHFARSVRAACHGMERCDSTALAHLFEEGSEGESTTALSPSARAAAAYLSRFSSSQRAALRKLTPTSAILLVVSALFDRLCLLWNSTPGYAKGAQELFVAYFSALCNLLQCSSTPVLQRVCASIEAIEVEHLRGAGNVQLQFLKYVSAVVDSIQGPSKVGIAEWFLKMNQRIQEENYGRQSKL